jgi:hypothetical protein
VDDVLHGGGSDRDPGGAGGGLVGVTRRFWRDHKATAAWVFIFVYVTVVAAVGFDSQRDFNAEALRARDANCLQFERDHLADVTQLRQTYFYLAQLRDDELGDAINRFVIARLPETERLARTDTSPDYCDAPGLGLPEPDPVLPKRPAGF